MLLTFKISFSSGFLLFMMAFPVFTMLSTASLCLMMSMEKIWKTGGVSYSGHNITNCCVYCTLFKWRPAYPYTHTQCDRLTFCAWSWAVVWSCSSLISPIDSNFPSASVSQDSSPSAACSNWKQTKIIFHCWKHLNSKLENTETNKRVTIKRK